jgi:hypothetical protein
MLSVWMRSFDGVSSYSVRLLNSFGELNVTVTPTWQRFSVVSTSTSTNAQIAVRGDQNQQTADVLIWGAQLEAGSFATSYIPTVASQVTRNADVATMTGTNFSSWYNQPEGTFVADFDDYSGIANFANIYRADDGTVNNRICILKNGSNTSIRFEVTTAGSGQALLGTTIGSAVNPTRHASAYKDNDFAACANGGTVATDGAGTVPSGINILRLGRDTTGALGNLLNGHIRQLAYFNSRLPNAQLQALTAPPLITSLSLDFINGVYEG